VNVPYIYTFSQTENQQSEQLTCEKTIVEKKSPNQLQEWAAIPKWQESPSWTATFLNHPCFKEKKNGNKKGRKGNA